ncbi:MAG: DUF2164 domain-containing protein [Bacillota bacterium]|jgi:uncharacterized protein (DUF2164 family)
MGPKFNISKEKRDEMVGLIKKWFREERGEDLGDLAAILILDFFSEELAPHFYNEGVYDSYRFVSRLAEDLLGIQKL